MTPSRRRLLHWGAVAAVAVLLALAARTVDWRESWRAVRHASPWLVAAAVAANLASLGARGVRWWVFLRRAGPVSLGTALRGAVVGSGFNNLLPASGGEAVRVLLVARRAAVPVAAVLAATALDRLVELLTSVALFVAAPLVVPLPAALARWRVPASVAFAVLLVAALALARRAARGMPAATSPVARARTPSSRTPSSLAPSSRTPSSLAPVTTGWRAHVSHFGTALGRLPTPRRLGAAVAISLASWAGQAAAYHLAAQAAGFPAPPVATFAAMLAVNVAFVFQLTPGNVGVFQLIYALVMRGFGLSHHAAVGVALLIQAIQIIPVTVLAVVLAGGERRKAIDGK